MADSCGGCCYEQNQNQNQNQNNENNIESIKNEPFRDCYLDIKKYPKITRKVISQKHKEPFALATNDATTTDYKETIQPESEIYRQQTTADCVNDQEKQMENSNQPMGSIGPWATGRVDWSPLAGLTGTRPVVDHYSITRFSPNEWIKRNLNILNQDTNVFNQSLKTDNDSKNTMNRTFTMIDQNQSNNTKRLNIRTADINKWKNTLERAIQALVDEIVLLEEQRVRLKQSMFILKTPYAIATECLDRRTGRPDTELVRDNCEEELIKEIALISEINDLFIRTLNDIDLQQVANRTARERLEYDWSDKKDSSEIDAINCCLTNSSPTILFKAGATRYMNDQSSEEYWEHFTMETLADCEKTRQLSITLRGTLNDILMNATRDLRTQANTVESALNARIYAMDEIRVKLENDLSSCLQHLADTEKLIDSLTKGMSNLDNCMKVAQTRLDNRNLLRPHVENCRDHAQIGLVDEVKNIQEGVSAMLAQINEAENTKIKLMNQRSVLEREIMLKRRAIQMDRDRCLVIRSHYPSVTALSGY